ncbi:MAG: efflux RND transporter periplasmic adaptor subunit [Nitrosomonas sp.]
MKKHVLYLFVLILTIFFFTGCSGKSADKNNLGEGKIQESPKGNAHKEHAHEEHAHEEHDEEGLGTVHLSALKFNGLGIKVDTLPTRSLSGVVDVNGRLALFPQHTAIVTAILGANVTAIKVIEGEKVKKGQVLAYLSHPNLTNLQTAYIRTYNQMQYLEKEFERQKRLYDEGVSSGKIYQQTRADYRAIKGEVKGFEAQLEQLSINVRKIRDGNIYKTVPVVSPIDGNIKKVLVQIGQFVNAQAEILRIINIEYVHADLMVFEKDVNKVKEGQKVSFTVESVPGEILSAKIFSVGKNFEQNPRIVHVHAEIDQKEFFLIPGMYINGKIYTESMSVIALPEEAIVVEDGKSYIFMAEELQEDGQTEWEFTPVEIRTGNSDEGWVEINLLESLPKDAQVVWNNAYYLIAEMKKGETSHEH